MRIVWFLGMTIVLNACAYSTYNYYYVSLESVEDIKIVRRAKAGLKDLRENSEIPVEYRLSRKAYALHFVIGDKGYYPHLHIQVTGADSLILQHRRNLSEVSGEGNICSSFYLDQSNRSAMTFAWLPSCREAQIKKTIPFDVIDLSGAVVGKEDIPFTVKQDGQYTLLDAI